MTTETSVLAVHNLSISFRVGNSIRSAIRNVHFEISAGQTLAIVGESGSGKTVSSLCIMGLLDNRKAVFEGGEIIASDLVNTDHHGTTVTLKPGSEELKKLRGAGIAMIFQEPMTALNPVMTCGEQVEEMLMLHEHLSKTEASIRTVELFREVKLPNPEKIPAKYPFELSGGQRQRVMIAMAISCNPKVLIADEPTTALDVTVQRDVLLLLKSIQQKHGMSMIFITHDLGIVKEIADQIVVMRKGDVVETGEADRVLNHPQHSYTKGLLACKPSPQHKNKRLPTLSEMETGAVESKTGDANLKGSDKTSNQDFLLCVHDLSKVYTSKRLFGKNELSHAVNRVSFEIRRGETMGLVGESGCGKTTLSRMLLGLIPSTEGNIIFSFGGEEYDLASLSKQDLRKLRKDIQIIFQDPYSSLNPKHTIGHAITEPMEVFGLHRDSKGRKEKAISLLEKVGMLPEHFNRYPHEFSGGQRQRIVIARALANEPSFIICDESVSALDVSVQAQVLNLLNDLKRDFSLTYLFISHDLNVVYYMSDHILVMKNGIIEERGTAHDVFYKPQSSYTQKLLEAIPGGWQV